MGVCISTSYTTNLVLPNGAMHKFNHPITVAELMLENPQSFVVEFQSNSSKKLLPLSADQILHPKKVYIMMPMARGKVNGVSVEDARNIVSEARLKGLKEKERAKKVEKVEVRMGALFEEEMELLCRQYSSKGWKPSLCTIEERAIEKEKIPHWLF